VLDSDDHPALRARPDGGCGTVDRPAAPAVTRTRRTTLTPFRAPQRLDRPWRSGLRVFGVRADTAGVVLDDDGFHARFGRLRVDAPWEDVAGACVTGPYRWYRAIGPRLSLADRGATFGSATAAGTCVTFHRPVAGLFGRRRVHPGLTVTVEDPHALRDAIEAELARRA
jgi:hypothetical protein